MWFTNITSTWKEDTLLKLRDFAPFAIEASVVIRVKNCQNLGKALLISVGNGEPSLHLRIGAN